jgi:hypothetical protein
MTLDSSGNLGLGVTPSAWSGIGPVLQVEQASLVSESNDQLYLTANAYFAGGAWNYIASDIATQYYQAAGAHVWRTAPSGTAGNAITFTQAMTLDANGDFTVGSTSIFNNGAGTRNISFHTASSQPTYVKLSNGATGNTSNDGFDLIMGTSSDAYLYNRENGPMIFGTNNTERARITAGGYFKASNDGTYIGSTGSYHEFRTSAADWTVRTSSTTSTAANCYGVYIKYSNAAPNGTGNEFLFCEDNAVARATIRSNGGLANYQANDVNLSDERTKKDIAPLGSMWAKFKALEIVTFKYKDQTHDDDNIGLIAQQVEAVAPEFVDVDGWGETPEDGVPLKSIYTADMYHAAIKALQEAMARIELLEAKVAALEAK